MSVQSCKDIVKVEDSEIINYMISDAYETIATKAMSNADWDKAHAEAENFLKIA